MNTFNDHSNFLQLKLHGKNIILIFIFCFFLCCGVFGEVIVIDDIEELQKIGHIVGYPLNGVYELSGNIDASDTLNWNSGAGFKPIGTSSNPFVGKFDGKGYKIMDLYINLPNEDYIGLFSHVGLGGDIIKVTIEACQIVGRDYVGGLIGWNEGGTILNSSIIGLVEGRYYIGGLTGWNASAGLISVSSNMGLIKGENSVGGLVGLNDESTVLDSFSAGSIQGSENSIGGLVGWNTSVGRVLGSYNTGTVEGKSYVGGLVGHNDSSIVISSYSTGTVKGHNASVGGLIGYSSSGGVSNCYSTGAVEGNSNVGGLIGTNASGVTVTNCYSMGLVVGTISVGGLIGISGGTVNNSYWDIQTSGQSTSVGGTGKTTAEMKLKATFIGWDFGTYWNIIETFTYPFLRGFEYADDIPQIVLLGENEVTIECGAVYVDAGATAFDIPDGDLTSQIEVTNNVNSNVVGDYTVEYSVTDTDGNTSSIVTRLVYVEDTTSPNITLNGDNPMTVECNSVFVDPGANAADTCDSEVSVEVLSNNVNTSQTGTYQVIYYAVDDSGNSAEKTREVIVDCAGEGTVEGVVEGTTEGEGISEGVVEGEGIIEGVVEGEGITEGAIEGEGITEGVTEGEGVVEGEGTPEGEMPPHSADPNGDGIIDLGELLRVIQFFNMGGYHCEAGTEDGYAGGYDGDKTCTPHASDYDEQDWTIDLGELLRLIQFFNMGGYYPCPGIGEDGYCPGIE
ncbi:MAG TPA: DUF5011 domain-containing protein [Candidatus Hydrogenedens sp.]|nr:DUF5011 domain-containing protein [Candidatus Hydrogenedens sp.]